MNNLIAISNSSINGQTIQTVSARELHEFLEVRKDFSDWIKVQLKIFTQGVDFAISTPKRGEGSNRIEYALTIDCAKHVAMMSRTEKGRKARYYFIECERLSKEAAAQPSAFAIPQTLPEALRLAADLADECAGLAQKNAALEGRIEADAPKVAALERFASHDGQLGLRSGAKVLGVREHKLKAWLLINRWYYRDHCGRLCAYADKIAAGYLDTVPVEIRRSTGIEVVPQPVITQKGLARLAELLAKDGLLPGAPKEAA